jgi:uncharacterized circularly permuted ATP-grasp superfamily protein
MLYVVANGQTTARTLPSIFQEKEARTVAKKAKKAAKKKGK